MTKIKIIPVANTDNKGKFFVALFAPQWRDLPLGIKGHEYIPKETIIFLKNWWSNHILKMDREYKKFIPDK